MIKAYKAYWNGYLDFKGTTSVGGYWWALLANFLATFVVSFLSGLVNARRPDSIATVSITIVLLGLLPSLAIVVRRLRDAGYEWTNIFWVFVPLVGAVLLIIKLCQPSQEGVCKPVTQPVGTSGAPGYRSYAQPAASQALPTSQPAPRPSILHQYRVGLAYLESCGAFDEAKFRIFNHITGNRFSENDLQKQLAGARMMAGGMENLRAVLRSTMQEGIQTFEALEQSGIDLSAYPS